MSGELYFGIPGLISATLCVFILTVIVRFIAPGPRRTSLLLLVAATFTYGLGDGLARMAAAASDPGAASAWFTIRFFGLALVPPALVHYAGSSTGLSSRLWFSPGLALVYTGFFVGILVRVGTDLIIRRVEVVDQVLVVTPGDGYRPFGVYGLIASAAACALLLNYARSAPTAADRTRARAAGVAVLLPFSVATAFFVVTQVGTSPSFDPIVPFLTGAVLVLFASAIEREVPASTLTAIRTIFASLPDGIVIADRKGLVRFSNPAANTMLSVPGAGLEGEHLMEALARSALSKDDVEKVRDAFARVEGGKAPLVQLSIEISGPPSRALRGILAVADQTSPKRQGKTTAIQMDRFVFLSLHEETDARSREIMLSRANEVKDLFISMIGHDLKAPLSAIAGYGELIALDAQAAPDGLAVYRYAQSILASARQIQLMMENARLFSRLVDPQDILRSREPVDLAALVLKEAKALEQAAERKGVAVESQVSGNAKGVRVFAAPILRSVFQNLIDNAVKYTADKSRVDLRVARDGKDAVVSVEDRGPGVPPDKREAIFRRFTRLEQTRTKTEGLGLGLAIARQLVELHGGSIAVKDRADGKPGAVFEVRMPVDQTKVEGAPPAAHEGGAEGEE